MHFLMGTASSEICLSTAKRAEFSLTLDEYKGKHNKTHLMKFRLDGNCKFHSSDQEPKLSKNTEDLASRVRIQPLPGHKIHGHLDLILCSKGTEILIQIAERTQLPAGTDTTLS